MKSRHTCPVCRRPRKYTRFIDQETGKHLPMKYGRCERLQSCGYFLNPYKDGYGKRVRSGPFQEGSNSQKSFNLTRTKETTFIPADLFRASLKGYDQNYFVRYLNGLLGISVTSDLIQRFRIGTSKFWEGSTIFWIIDRQGKIAGGQVILYDESGSTKKEILPDNSIMRYNSWVHTAIKSKYQKQKRPLPKWLKIYIENSPKFPCLFGLPQLEVAPPHKPVAIVESAKTAVIATACLPQYIWLATGSLSYLNRDRISDLKGRNITLFPDKGGFEFWERKIPELSKIANIGISDLLERKKAKDGADIADYLVRYDLQDFQPESQKNSAFCHMEQDL